MPKVTQLYGGPATATGSHTHHLRCPVHLGAVISQASEASRSFRGPRADNPGASGGLWLLRPTMPVSPSRIHPRGGCHFQLPCDKGREMATYGRQHPWHSELEHRVWRHRGLGLSLSPPTCWQYNFRQTTISQNLSFFLPVK